MSLQPLLTSNKLKAHSTSRREIDDLRNVVNRDLADATIVELSSDRRFATAYNAALQTATMAIACAGYRTSGTGHHQTTIEAAGIVLGASSKNFVIYFDHCRRMRNILDYDRTQVATDTEADEILEQAKAFLALTEEWIALNYPNL